MHLRSECGRRTVVAVTGADPWTILGLPAGASVAEARAARKRLAKRLHPDLYAGDSGEERSARSAQMILVNRALADIEARSTESAPTAEPVDGDSFTVEYLPVDAYEALFLVAYGLGDILSSDEPYRLEVYLTEPAPCFCQMTLVPEAGGSIVMVDVEAPGDGTAPPPAAAVKDVLVAGLKALTPDG